MTSVLSLVISIASLFASDTTQIVFVGDAMQHQSQLDAARCSDGTYDYSPSFKALKPYIESADYAVANLETPLGGAPRYSGYPTFSAPDSYAKALVDVGFDLLLTANNHTLDRRDYGLRRTIDVLDTLKVGHIGTYHNKAHADSVNPMIVDINSIKIAFLNYTYGTNGITEQGDVIVNRIDTQKIEEDITTAKETGAELVTVCIHWGDEYKLLPNASQQKLADKIFDMGADMIIGSHPHVIQPIELRPDKATGRNKLLVYSLGNFISGMRTTDTRGGAMVKVYITRDSLGCPCVAGASYRLIFTVPPQTPNDTYKVVPAEKTLIGDAAIKRDAFVKNAESIFTQHNVNVPRDCAPFIKLPSIPHYSKPMLKW